MLHLQMDNSRSESLIVINIMIVRGMVELKGRLHPKVVVIVYLRWIKILGGCDHKNYNISLCKSTTAI